MSDFEEFRALTSTARTLSVCPPFDPAGTGAVLLPIPFVYRGPVFLRYNFRRLGWLGPVSMAIWKEFEGWTYEYFDRDIEPAALPGFEDMVRLWQDRRGDRAVPSWSDFDFYDFKGWHGRISVYDISYDPFDYTNRLSGTAVDGVFDRTMTGATASDLEDMRIEHPDSMAFYEMICREMLISRQTGTLNFKGREHVPVTFVEFPLSDDGQRATHTLEALIGHDAE